MKLITTALMQDASAEIATLIETLYRTDLRLEELTAGGVDSVASVAGQTFMLQRAQAQLHHYEADRQAAILNALPAGVALLDSCGSIISVNAAWENFTCPNLLQNSAYGIGDNYLDICAGAKGDGASDAHQAAVGIQSVLQGPARSFSLEYSCLVAGALDWFMLTITRLSEKRRDGGV